MPDVVESLHPVNHITGVPCLVHEADGSWSVCWQPLSDLEPLEVMAHYHTEQAARHRFQREAREWEEYLRRWGPYPPVGQELPPVTRRARLLRVEDGPRDWHGEPSWRFWYRNNLGDPNGETEVDQIVEAYTEDEALRCLVRVLRALGIELDTRIAP